MHGPRVIHFKDRFPDVFGRLFTFFFGHDQRRLDSQAEERFEASYGRIFIFRFWISFLILGECNREQAHKRIGSHVTPSSPMSKYLLNGSGEDILKRVSNICVPLI